MIRLQLLPLEEGVNGGKVLNRSPCNKRGNGDSWGRPDELNVKLSFFFFSFFLSCGCNGRFYRGSCQCPWVLYSRLAAILGCFCQICQWSRRHAERPDRFNISFTLISFYALYETRVITRMELQTISYPIARTNDSPLAVLRGYHQKSKTRDADRGTLEQPTAWVFSIIGNMSLRLSVIKV